MKRKHTSKRALRRMRRRVEQAEHMARNIKALLVFEESQRAVVSHAVAGSTRPVIIRETTISPHDFEAD